ncbi:hypothetical protein D5266_08915, partial [bacterium c-19]|nr:hypothetical protein [bacterium c-19]
MKRIGFICCIIFAFIIGIPVMNGASDIMRAAEYTGEKIIDFEFPQIGDMTGGSLKVQTFAISERGNLFRFDSAPVFLHGSGEYSLLEKSMLLCVDETGKPLEFVKKISGISLNSVAETEYIALRADGKLYVNGYNGYGKFGNGTTDVSFQEEGVIVETGIDDIIDVEAGTETNYILTSNGDVYASGNNASGQFGNGTTESSTTFTKANISDVKKISVGGGDTVYALKNDGTVYAWGRNVYDGKNQLSTVTTPIPLYMENKTDFFTDVIDIDSFQSYGVPGVAILTHDGTSADVYYVGKLMYSTAYPPNVTHYTISQAISDKATLFVGGNKRAQQDYAYNIVLFDNGSITDVPIKGSLQSKLPADLNFKKVDTESRKIIGVTDDGDLWIDDVKVSFKLPLVMSGIKQKDNSAYLSEEKYNDSIQLNVLSDVSTPPTCQVENPLGGTAVACSDYSNDSIMLTANNQRLYRKYIMTNDIMSTSFVVDLYKNEPVLKNLSPTVLNKLKLNDRIDLSVPTEQSSWNAYSATITDQSDNTTDYVGGTLAVGKYRLTVTDSYGNTQIYQLEVSDKPTPTADFTPSSTTLTYGDNPTKVSQAIGKFSLSYPAGEPTSTIKTIQLGTAGDEDHFSIDTSGNLKVKGNDLDAGTYSVTVSGTDGNDMAFTKTVSITVAKKDQNNYQITNSANYPLQVNQEIAITTSGNESGGSETYSITSGNTFAQISNGNKFKILDSGTFTLEATVAGNTNYNSKTVTKQITISQLPTQNPPVSITSKDSMMYGDTYTPSYSGGQGSGAISWAIESDNGTGAVLNNGSIKVTGIGSFTLKVTKAGTSSYQESSATKVITVNKRKTTVKPKDVTKVVGEAFKPNGAAYNPQPISGDNLGTLTITSKYPDNQVPGRYTDGIQASGLS